MTSQSWLHATSSSGILDCEGHLDSLTHDVSCTWIERCQEGEVKEW